MSTRRREAPTTATAVAPFVVRWDARGQPLPRCPVHAGRRRPILPRGHEAPPWLDTGPAGEPFEFCAHVRRLCEDITARCESLGHIDVSRILFGFTQARNGRSHGLQARVTPLRFRHGALTRTHRGTPFQVQRYFVDGREMLYVIAFCLPRFLDRDFDDKFVTLFHELYHISPMFDGDLRRHAGRYDVHTSSQHRYDQEMGGLAREYLSNGADRARHGFLRLSFAQLLQRHGSIVGYKIPRPKLIPLR
jgi:hypothetical protein